MSRTTGEALAPSRPPGSAPAKASRKKDVAIKLDLDYDAPENKYNRKRSFWEHIPLIGYVYQSFGSSSAHTWLNIWHLNEEKRQGLKLR
jgi:hypothetical protein